MSPNGMFLLWLVWAIGSAWLIRTAFLRLLSPRIGRRMPHTTAYLCCGGLFLLGQVLVGLTGMPLYGFDSHNWHH